MEGYVILHDLSGSFLVVENGHENRPSPQLPSLTEPSGDADSHAVKILCLVAATFKSFSEEVPLAVRHYAYDEDEVSIATVVELLCRRCAIVLKAGYTWTPITPAFLEQIKGRYSPPIWQAISNISAETLENALDESVPIFARRGFRKQVTNTIRSRLKDSGRGRVLGVRQINVTRVSAVFAVRTSEMITMFYKITTKGCPEALYTQTLARLLPELVVAPFGVNVTDNSFFTEDFQETIRDGITEHGQEFANKHFMGPSVAAIAEFHQKASKHVEELKRAGMDDTSPQQMRMKLPDFISEMQEMEILSEEGAQIMRKQLPTVSADLDFLTNGKVPVTVCHCDLHEENLTCPRSADDKPMLFDWYGSTISHPFLDIHHGNFNEDPWLELYAEKWTAYDSLDKIWQLIDTARYLATLWDVFRYVKKMARDDYPDGVENSIEFCRDVLGHFVKQLEIMAE